jgi:lysozyme
MTLREQLERDEGFRHVAYQDTAGHWTVGVGHNLETPISTAAVEQILTDDINTASDECANIPFFSTLSEARQAALINMCFNLGFAGLMSFRHMLAHLQAEEWTQAAQELLNSHYHAQVGARAERLALQIETDTFV